MSDSTEINSPTTEPEPSATNQKESNKIDDIADDKVESCSTDVSPSLTVESAKSTEQVADNTSGTSNDDTSKNVKATEQPLCKNANDSDSLPDNIDPKLNSSFSDHELKPKPKSLESEAEQRNTSTSNAGESEYESANEEDIDFAITETEMPNTNLASIEELDGNSLPKNSNTVISNSDETKLCDDSKILNVDAAVQDVCKNLDDLTIAHSGKTPDNNDTKQDQSGDDVKKEIKTENSDNHPLIESKTILPSNNTATNVETVGDDKVNDENNIITHDVSNYSTNEKKVSEPTVDLNAVATNVNESSKVDSVSGSCEEDQEQKSIVDEEEISIEDEYTDDIEHDPESFDEVEQELQSDDECAIDDETESNQVDIERENGDGEEECVNQDGKSAKSSQSVKQAKRTELEDKRNPQYIPRKGPFYEHDVRMNEDDEEEENVEDPSVSNKVAAENDENDVESIKLKAKKKLLASMKLCSDEMIDEESNSEKTFKQSIIVEKADVITNKNATETKLAVETTEESESKPTREPRRKPIWDSGERWSHDKFNIDDQKPKTREELINAYGYDIRSELDPPRLQRRSKYGKGPQKYSRRSEDENAYGKRTTRKVIRGSSKNSEYQDQSAVNNVSKKDKIFNNQRRSTSKDRKDSRKPRPSPSDNPSFKSSNKYSDSQGNNRMHENDRVFVNKSGQSSKFSKSNADKSPKSNYAKDNFAKSRDNSDTKQENNAKKELDDNNNSTNSKPKKLFTNEDFPALVSSPPSKSQPPSSATATTSSSTDSSKNQIIYYSNPPNARNNEQQKGNNHNIAPTQSATSNDSRNNKDSSPQTNQEGENSRQNKTVHVVKSQLFENSRYSRTRINASNQEFHQNWNNRSNDVKHSPQFSNSHNHKKHHTNVTHSNEDEKPTVNEANIEDSRPKRYSSIRQQRNLSTAQPSPSNGVNSSASVGPSVVSTPNIHSSPSTQGSNFAPVNQTASPPQPQYISLNPDGTASNLISTDAGSKAQFYETPAAPTNEIANTNMMATGPSHHHSAHSHNYASLNGTANVANQSGATAYIPTGAQLMAYYDPTNNATGQPGGNTTSALQAPLGLAQAYYTTDQTGAAQAGPNYYLTTADLTAVAYHPAAAYHLQASYPQALTSHQQHVTNRYLNATPSSVASDGSNRYLQTANQNSPSLMVTGGVANIPSQAYQPAMQTSYPSGYPQFPPPAPTGGTPTMGTSSPLPAGYPNVQLASTNTNNSGSNGAQPTAPGYPELYRGGITYYDIQSQQQAMQRQLHQNMSQQLQQPSQQRRTKSISHQHQTSGGDNANNKVEVIGDSADGSVEQESIGQGGVKSQPHNSSTQKEISVNN